MFLFRLKNYSISLTCLVKYIFEENSARMFTKVVNRTVSPCQQYGVIVKCLCIFHAECCISGEFVESAVVVHNLHFVNVSAVDVLNIMEIPVVIVTCISCQQEVSACIQRVESNDMCSHSQYAYLSFKVLDYSFILEGPSHFC